MEKIQASMRSMNRLGRESIDQDRTQLRIEHERDMLAEKLRQEQAKTLRIEEAISRQKSKQNHESKETSKLDRLHAMADRMRYASPMTMGFNNIADYDQEHPANQP